MNATNLRVSNFSDLLKEDFLGMSSARKSKKQSQALADHYESHGGSNDGMNIIGNLIDSAEVQIAENFQKLFVFGIQLTIWRKGRTKQCVFFVDQNLPSFLWISSCSKAFLFDLSFTTIQRFDFELQNTSQLKNYFILRYFQEELPVVFQGENAANQSHQYFELFNSYIVYNRIMEIHPCYFSKILKNSIIEDIKEDIVRSKQAKDILKVSNQISWNSQQFNQTVMRYLISGKGAKANFEILLTPEEINDYFKITSCCQGIKEVFQKYCGVRLNNYHDYLRPVMAKQSFLQFLANEQNESEQILTDVSKQYKDILSFYDFCLYLVNEKSNYAAAAEPIDENLPLTDYYCYSSHNTYLSGNQLTSDSKIQRYLEDLDNGLKCVELDVHNDGNRPIITHAFQDKSFCKPIDFEETINAISKFCSQHQGHYPIILSIQNHAKEENRFKMFNILAKAFGRNMFLVNNELELHQLQICKTLRELKGRIIVKTDSAISQIKPFKKSNNIENQLVVPNSIPLGTFLSKSKFPVADFSQRHFQHSNFKSRGIERKTNFQLQFPKQLYLPLQQMTKMTSIFKAPQGIETVGSGGYECTSLTNEKAAKAAENLIISYTKRSWLRIYPLASQIASSNYDPTPHLKIGAQIIALNTQTKDDPARMMMSYFTGGREMIASKIGYIPKPLHLRKESQIGRKEVVKMIEIKLFSNEKIKIRFLGSEQDMKNNANSTFNFNVRDYLQGFLMFEIGEDYKDCIALRFLRRGYRVLIGKNAFFRDSGKRVLFYTNIKDLPKA